MAIKSSMPIPNLGALAKDFPIADRVAGWCFRVTEFSPGGYRAEGRDAYGRRVSADDTNPDAALEKSVAMAKGISKGLHPGE